MAKILLGATIGDARGSVGAATYSKNQHGAYLRQKVSPVQPRSPRQLQVRSNFSILSKAWATVLSDVQRAGWRALAAANPVIDVFGNSGLLSGIQFYQRVNRNLQEISQPRMDDPPPDQAVEQITSLSLSAIVTGSVFALTFTPQTLAAGDHLVVFATPTLNPGRSFAQNFLTLLFGDPNDQTGSPLDLFTPYHDRFGQLQETQRIFVEAFVVNENNGAASTPALASAIVAL